MRTAPLAVALAAATVLAGPRVGGRSFEAPAEAPQAARIHPEEKHFRNLRQLTRGGENAEGYWSPDGRQIIYQRKNEAEGVACDQEFVVDVASGASRRVSSGKGRTTCGYFTDGGRRVLYASTERADPACPPPADYSKGYVWPMYAGYDIVTANADGSSVRRLTETPGYDAEATLSPDGKAIVFTSVRDGDLEIYTMKADGSDVKRLTHEPGYDGGPFFSPDGDGSQKRQVTRLGAASFAPYFHPDGKRILFSSNHPEPKGRNFDLYLVKDDGSGLERITSDPAFDGFPMFSPDGKHLVFASNRGAKARGETNVFVAEWVE